MKGLHPLSLLILALWFSTNAIAASSPSWLAVILALNILLAVILVGVRKALPGRQLLQLMPLFLLVMLIQLLFVKQGKTLWGSGWYAIYSGGLAGGVSFCLRLLILFVSAKLLLRLDFEDFEAAFHSLRLPEELSFMVFYALHILPLFASRVRHQNHLVLMRGVVLSRLRPHKLLRLYGQISLTLLAELLLRSNAQAIALELRGFRSSGPRTRLESMHFGWRDLILLLAVGLASGFAVWLRHQ